MGNISRQIMVMLSCQTIASQNSLIIVSHTVPNLQFLSKKFNPNLMKHSRNSYNLGAKIELKFCQTWILGQNLSQVTFGTLFENHPKGLIRILAFSTNFCPIKFDLSGSTVWQQASDF